MTVKNIVQTLHQGRSTQPPHFRIPGQVEISENVLHDFVGGARKRPGSRYVTRITSPEPPENNDYRMFTIDRGDGERYVVVHGYATGGSPPQYVVRVFNAATGAEVTNTVSAAAQAYLNINANPGSNTRAKTVVDSTFITNRSVPVDVLPTPNYTVTDSWQDQDALFRHTPTDGTYHYAEAEDAYWQYDVDGKTFGTARFAEVWAPAATPSGDWARTGVHAARLQFGRFDVVGGTGMTFTPDTPVAGQHTITKTGAFSGYSHRQGDLIGISAGTGLTGASYAVDIWFDVVSKTDNDNIVIEDNSPTARLPGGSQTDFAADYIGPRYVVTYNNGGFIDDSMQTIARKLTESVQGAGAYDVLIEFRQSGSTGYFTVTTPTRGTGSRFVEALSGSDTDVGPNLLTDQGLDLAAPGITRPFGTLASSTAGSGSVTFGTDDTLAVSLRWNQVPMPNAPDGTIDANTMPVRMVRNRNGTFSTDVVDWQDRALGDEVSNPSPELFTRADRRGAITSASVANPTAITSAGHGLMTGDVIDIRGSNSTPSIDGTRTVTVTSVDTFTIPVNVTSAGSAGGWSRGGAPINDIMYHRGRLLFVGDEYLVASRQDDLFDFYLEDPEEVVDTDRIVVQVAGEGVSILDSVRPIRQTIFLASQDRQFELTADGPFSPQTVAIDPTTSHTMAGIGSVIVGPSLFFVSKSSGNWQLREYLYVESIVTQSTNFENQHADIIERGLTRITGDPDSQTIFLLKSRDSKMLCYRVGWDANNKVQQAWSEWKFDPEYEILDAEVMAGNLYMLVESAGPSNQYVIERIPILGETPAAGSPFDVHLDRQRVLTGTTSSTNTRFDIAPMVALGSTFNSLVYGDQFQDGGTEVRGTWTYNPGGSNPTLIDVPGTAHAGSPVVMGRFYEMKVGPTRPYVRTDQGEPDLTLELQGAFLSFRADGGEVKSTVTHTSTNFPTSTRTYTVPAGTVADRTLHHMAPIKFGAASHVITSDDARPLDVVYVAYESLVTRRNR